MGEVPLAWILGGGSLCPETPTFVACSPSVGERPRSLSPSFYRSGIKSRRASNPGSLQGERGCPSLVGSCAPCPITSAGRSVSQVLLQGMPDTVMDAVMEAVTEAVKDTRMDTVADTVMDAMDTMMDTMKDTGTDTGLDTRMDTGTDTRTDTGMDSVMDPMVDPMVDPTLDSTLDSTLDTKSQAPLSDED